MTTVAPVQNRLTLMAIEKSRVHGEYVFLSLIVAIGTLLAGIGVYGYDAFSFKVGMYTAAGVAIALSCWLIYRRLTHISRQIQQTLKKLDANIGDDLTNFSYLFSLFIAQDKGYYENRGHFWHISLFSSATLARFNTFLDMSQATNTDPPILGENQICIQPGSSSTYNLFWRLTGSTNEHRWFIFGTPPAKSA